MFTERMQKAETKVFRRKFMVESQCLTETERNGKLGIEQNVKFDTFHKHFLVLHLAEFLQ